MMNLRYWASAFYFLYYAATGALLTFLNLFYLQAGMDPTRIGFLASLVPLASLVAAPLWGALADALRLHQRLLPLAMLATLPPVLFLQWAHTLPTLSILVLVFAICLAPIVPLGDHAVLTMLGAARHEYGKLRIWGAVGWGVSAVGAGALIERWGIGLAFAAYLSLMLLGALIATKLHAPRAAVSQSYGSGLRRFIMNARWLRFLIAIFLAGLCLSTLSNYLVLYFRGLGAHEALYGIAVATANVSELPIFFLSSILLRKFSARALLSTSILLLALRAFLLSVITNPYWAIAAQLLHGPTFSAMWAAGVSYTSETGPKGLGASAQAVFGATLYGLAGTVGALLGGRLYDVLGPVVLFRVAGVIALVGTAVLMASEYRAQKQVRSTNWD